MMWSYSSTSAAIYSMTVKVWMVILGNTLALSRSPAYFKIDD